MSTLSPKLGSKIAHINDKVICLEYRLVDNKHKYLQSTENFKKLDKKSNILEKEQPLFNILSVGY